MKNSCFNCRKPVYDVKSLYGAHYWNFSKRLVPAVLGSCFADEHSLSLPVVYILTKVLNEQWFRLEACAKPP